MAESTQQIYSQLPQFLKEAISAQIRKATEEELENAKKRIEERKAEIITGVVLHVEKMVNFQTMKDSLIITVKTQ